MKAWTLKPRDGGWYVLRRGICVGTLMIHASGYADWSFSAGCAPSRSTLRRLLAEAADMCPPAASGVANHPSCSIRQGIENSMMELRLAERGFVRCSWCRVTPDRCDHCQSWHDSAERERNRLSSLLTTYDRIERGLLAVPRCGTNGG